MAAPVSNQGDYSYVGWTPQTMDYDSGTDTDTVTSEGQTAYTYADIPRDLEPNQTAEHLFWAYQQAKGRYRKFMGKPIRHVRRFFKKRGKGKGKHSGTYLASLNDYEVSELFFKGKGKGKSKGKGKRSSGKGKGHRGNPRGPDGQIMTCRTCGSTEHFQRECPQ